MIAITPAVIIAIVTSPFMLIKLAVVWTIVQLVDGKFISPQIMGKSLQHPSNNNHFCVINGRFVIWCRRRYSWYSGYALLKVLITHLFKLYKLRYNKL